MLKAAIRFVLPDTLVGKIRAWRLRRRIAQYVPRVVTHKVADSTLHIQLADHLGEDWYAHDSPESTEISFLRQYRLKPGATVFNLGAHQCVVAMTLANVVAPAGKVVALEASRHNADVGRRNKELNALTNLEIMHAAASDRSGTLVFNEGLNGSVDDGSGQWGRTVVPAKSIDDLSLEFGPPDVLFVDVEGYECAVLNGAARVLTAPADWFIEVHAGCGLEKFGGAVDRIVRHFPTERFDLFMAPDTDYTPTPFRSDDPMTRTRFFFFAIAREK